MLLIRIFIIIFVISLCWVDVTVCSQIHDSYQDADLCLMTNYDDYDDYDSDRSLYDALCDQLPQETVPCWRLWLNKIGSMFFVSYVCVKEWLPLSSKSRLIVSKKLNK